MDFLDLVADCSVFGTRGLIWSMIMSFLCLESSCEIYFLPFKVGSIIEHKMFNHEFTPVENYFFVQPLDEPHDVGLIRLCLPEVNNPEWYPSFLFLYEGEDRVSD